MLSLCIPATARGDGRNTHASHVVCEIQEMTPLNISAVELHNFCFIMCAGVASLLVDGDVWWPNTEKAHCLEQLETGQTA